jgi:hypothetical protein
LFLKYSMTMDKGSPKAIKVKEWSRKDAAIMERDTCIRSMDGPILFLWILFYEEKHWTWLHAWQSASKRSKEMTTKGSR